MRMMLKDRGWNIGTDRASQDLLHNLSFGSSLDHQYDATDLHDVRKAQRDTSKGMFGRHSRIPAYTVLQRRIHTAYADCAFEGGPWLIESQMSILSKTQDEQVYASFVLQLIGEMLAVNIQVVSRCGQHQEMVFIHPQIINNFRLENCVACTRIGAGHTCHFVNSKECGTSGIKRLVTMDLGYQPVHIPCGTSCGEPYHTFRLLFDLLYDSFRSSEVESLFVFFNGDSHCAYWN